MNIAKKGNIINNLPTIFLVENQINPERVHIIKEGLSGEGAVIYFMERELRAVDNFGLNFAVEKANKLNKTLKIYHLFCRFIAPAKQEFYENELEILKTDMKLNNLDFEIIYDETILSLINKISPACVVIDFNPIRDMSAFDDVKYKVFEVDSHNIIPARYVSEKQEYSAFQFRRRVYNNIYGFFTEFKDNYVSHSNAYNVLADFIENKLDKYAEKKNNPDAEVVSDLSGYINFGFISSQRVALDVYKSETANENKEVFLEELIVRKELADNYCLYNENYKNLKGAPLWALRTLLKHKNDFRPITFSLKELENAQTNDIIWNAAQKELIKYGKIHGYLRMYWAKMLLYWTESPMDAIDAAIYLNDKYAFDAPSANGYVGILWSIAGLHDRPFREQSVTGKIRVMSSKSLYKKLKDGEYLKKAGVI